MRADDVQETACILHCPAPYMNKSETLKAPNLFRGSHSAGPASDESFENRSGKALRFDGIPFYAVARNTIDDVIGRLLPLTLKHRLIVVEFRRFDAEDILQRVNQSSRLLTLRLEFALNRILLFELTQRFSLFFVQLSLCFLDCLNQPQFRTPEIFLAIRTGECRIRQHIGGFLCHFLVFTENISRMAKTMFLCQPQEIQHEKVLFPFTQTCSASHNLRIQATTLGRTQADDTVNGRAIPAFRQKHRVRERLVLAVVESFQNVLAVRRRAIDFCSLEVPLIEDIA